MSWAAVDDRLHADPRRYKAGLPAMGVYLVARSWIADQLTDGFIPTEAAMSLSGGRQELIDRLVTVEFWELAEGGYTDIDYLTQNLPRAEILARKAARAASGAKGGAISVDVRRQQHGTAQPPKHLPKQLPKQVLRATEASPEALAEAATEPPYPVPRTPSFADAKAPYPRADAREAEPAKAAEDGVPEGYRLVDGAWLSPDGQHAWTP